ncbi:MAG: ferritin family protein [Pseudomonadota bacterium]
MGIKFSADEVFEMAEQIEKNGASYYRKAAENFTDPKVSKILNALAEMEMAHRIIFQALRQELKDAEKQPGAKNYADPEQTQAYLKVMADGKVFDVKENPAKKITGKESLADIFKKAIGMEKDSIVFYMSLKEFVPSAAGRDKVDGIIKEEMNHIVILNETWAGMR